MEDKQTAVEWLIEQYNKNSTYFPMLGITVYGEIPKETIDQAKAMEKQQLEKELNAFFLFIRNSGEHFIGMSIEQFVKYYLEKK